MTNQELKDIASLLSQGDLTEDEKELLRYLDGKLREKIADIDKVLNDRNSGLGLTLKHGNFANQNSDYKRMQGIYSYDVYAD